MKKYFFTSALLALCVSVGFGQTAKTTNKEQVKLKPRTVPTLQMENGIVTSKIDAAKRASTGTVCVGDKITFRAKVSGTSEAQQMPLKWTVSTGQGISDSLGNFIFDTTGLNPGTYTVTAEVLAPFKDCEGGCTAYDSKAFVVNACPTCFTTPTVELTSAAKTIQPGETISICSTPVSGGSNYGNIIPSWTTTGGSIMGDATCAKLDTTGLAPGSNVTVKLNLKSDAVECEAKGSITFKVAEATVVNAQEITPCTTFKFNNARVDNACKYILQDVVRKLEADPQAKLVIDGYYKKGESSTIAFERGKNVRDRLADGSVGVTIDANRLIVRPSGETADHQVRMYVIPSGAKIPTGAAAVNAGTVAKEVHRASAPRRR